MTRQSQSDRILAALRDGPKTTWQLGYELGICCPTKRISELREAGYKIEMSERWLRGVRGGRSKVRVCTYTLKGQMALPLSEVA